MTEIPKIIRGAVCGYIFVGPKDKRFYIKHDTSGFENVKNIRKGEFMGLFDAISNTFSGSSDDIWNTISHPSDLESILDKSADRPQLIYKHSNRCSVCFVAKGNLEQASEQLLEHIDMYYLNVVKNRSASDSIASKLNVHHESPQVILIDKGKVIWHASHGEINGSKILEEIS